MNAYFNAAFRNVVHPKSAFFDSTSHCQLKCPVCPTADGSTKAVLGRGFLKSDTFRKVLEDSPRLKHIELSNYGEAFLNPSLSEILRIAHERRVTITLINGVNLNNARDNTLEAVVKYGVQSISCSIDGTSQDTYKQYRRRGNFDQVMTNIGKINEFKRKYGSKSPQLIWQFVIFGHNEHEIDAARKMAAKLGMEIKFKLSWDSSFSPIRDRQKAEKVVGADSRETFREKYGEDYGRSKCHQLWNRPVINWDGKNLGCCANYWGEFGGNYIEDGFDSTVNSEKMRYARNMLMGKTGPRDEIPCTTCDYYKSIAKRGNWITLPEIYITPPLIRTLSKYSLTSKLRPIVRFFRPVLRRTGLVPRI